MPLPDEKPLSPTMSDAEWYTLFKTQPSYAHACYLGSYSPLAHTFCELGLGSSLIGTIGKVGRYEKNSFKNATDPPIYVREFASVHSLTTSRGRGFLVCNSLDFENTAFWDTPDREINSETEDLEAVRYLEKILRDPGGACSYYCFVPVLCWGHFSAVWAQPVRQHSWSSVIDVSPVFESMILERFPLHCDGVSISDLENPEKLLIHFLRGCAYFWKSHRLLAYNSQGRCIAALGYREPNPQSRFDDEMDTLEKGEQPSVWDLDKGSCVVFDMHSASQGWRSFSPLPHEARELKSLAENIFQGSDLSFVVWLVDDLGLGFTVDFDSKRLFEETRIHRSHSPHIIPHALLRGMAAIEARKAALDSVRAGAEMEFHHRLNVLFGGVSHGLKNSVTGSIQKAEKMQRENLTPSRLFYDAVVPLATLEYHARWLNSLSSQILDSSGSCEITVSVPLGRLLISAYYHAWEQFLSTQRYVGSTLLQLIDGIHLVRQPLISIAFSPETGRPAVTKLLVRRTPPDGMTLAAFHYEVQIGSRNYRSVQPPVEAENCPTVYLPPIRGRDYPLECPVGLPKLLHEFANIDATFKVQVSPEKANGWEEEFSVGMQCAFEELFLNALRHGDYSTTPPTPFAWPTIEAAITRCSTDDGRSLVDVLVRNRASKFPDEHHKGGAQANEIYFTRVLGIDYKGGYDSGKMLYEAGVHNLPCTFSGEAAN